MKKYFFCFFFVIIVCATVFAQQPVIAKAPPMVTMNPLTPDEASSVGRVYDSMLSEAGNIRIINQMVLEKGMRDYAFQQRDWTNLNKTLDLGDVLDVNWLIRPQMFKRPPTQNRNDIEIVFTVILLNIRTKGIVYTTPVVIRNINEIQNTMRPLINEITQIVTDGTGGLSAQSSSVYKVGDRGPAGGWVFHDKGNYSDGWRYLEVAPRGTETSVPKTKGVERISGLSKEMGSGKQNAALIIQSNLNQDVFTIVQATKICANMDLNWFKDWFLPSRLDMTWFSTHSNNNFAEFSSAYYWCSTDSDGVMFSIPGNKMPDRNMPNYSVRAVRAF
jgi:hypothetical protein